VTHPFGYYPGEQLMAKKVDPTDQAWPADVMRELIAWASDDTDHRTIGDMRAWLRARGVLPPAPVNPDGVSPKVMIGRPARTPHDDPRLLPRITDAG
jgi:hypothetical protein